MSSVCIDDAASSAASPPPSQLSASTLAACADNWVPGTNLLARDRSVACAGDERSVVQVADDDEMNGLPCGQGAVPSLMAPSLGLGSGATGGPSLSLDDILDGIDCAGQCAGGAIGSTFGVSLPGMLEMDPFVVDSEDHAPRKAARPPPFGELPW